MPDTLSLRERIAPVATVELFKRMVRAAEAGEHAFHVVRKGASYDTEDIRAMHDAGARAAFDVWYDAILPVVEQAIQQERNERDIEDAAAIEDIRDILAKYEQSLAEKDAQIAALRALLDTNPTATADDLLPEMRKLLEQG